MSVRVRLLAALVALACGAVALDDRRGSAQVGPWLDAFS